MFSQGIIRLLQHGGGANGEPVQPFNCQRKRGQDKGFGSLGELTQVRQVFQNDNAAVEKQAMSCQFVFVSARRGQIESQEFNLRLNQEFQSV